MLWAGVDLGTTHLKALLYDDRQRRVLDLAIAPTPTLHDGQLTSHDADDVVLTALGLLAGILDGDRARLLAGIGVSGVGEEIVTLDGDDRPTGPVLAWYDPRGHEEADTLAAGAPPRLHRRLAMDASYSLFKLLWLHAHRPDEFGRIRRVLDPSAYLLLRLGARATMDWSHASRTALFDPWTTAWDAETLRAAQLPGSSLPELVPSGTIVGTASSREAVTAGIPAGTPLVIGGHDHLCGAYASGVREPGDLYVSAGTSEAQLVVLPGAPESNVSTLNLDFG